MYSITTAATSSTGTATLAHVKRRFFTCKASKRYPSAGRTRVREGW